ncbi:TolC family protein [Oceanimonas marisflavi]|uniref:TolC family protein n=1 Tax=Oceanimonas marisflavi TaxID=2059724 RepID=UPI000D2F93D7|nr:TolC family protein [Oceanimonas marisflavi]
MFKKTLLASSLVLAISGCTVTPDVISPDNVSATVKADMTLLAQDQVQGSIGLEEAIARAVRNNRDKKLKALESAMEQGQLGLVRHEMLPSLTASAGYSARSNFAASASVAFQDGRPEPLGSNPSYSISQDKQRSTYDLALSWNVLDFGLSYVRAKQHADRYLIARERERKVTHNITQDVRGAYWRAVSAERLLQKIDPLIGQASAALNDSRRVELLQLRSPMEALYYQRELLDVLRSLQALKQELANAKTELAALMGLKPGTVFELTDVDAPDFAIPELAMKLETMEELALKQRPELVETYYQQRISAADTRAAMLKMLPGISLNAGVYHDNSDYLLNQDWTSLGAQVSWNLFDVFKVGAERDLAKTREAIAEEQRLASSMAVLTQVHLANIRYHESLKSFELADRYLQVAHRISEQTANAARMKRTSELELIRESLNTLLAELRRDVAYADLQNSYGRIFVSMGMDLLPEGYTQNSVEQLSDTIADRFDRWQKGELVAEPALKEASQSAAAGDVI